MASIKIFVKNVITKKVIPITFPKNINYNELIKRIFSEFNVDLDDYILTYNGDKFTENKMSILKDNITLNLVLNFEEEEDEDLDLDDKAFDDENIIKECFINTNFIENKEEKDDEILERKSLSGILNICLLKYISRDIDDNIMNKIKSPLKEIIETIKKEINFKNHAEEDIKAILNDKTGNNIFEYCKYINGLINKEILDNLIELFDNDKKEKFYNFWNKLMRFDEFNRFFEKELEIALRNSYFDYSVISMILYEKSRRKKYLNERKKCPNCHKRILFHGTQVDPISKIITTEFKYTRKAFYGMGIYFSDMLDYIGFYAGGNDYNTRRDNFGKILPVNQTFSCIASEIYYNEKKLKKINDFSLHVPELSDFPTYEYIKKNFPKQMVVKNGIHLAKVEPSQGQVLEEESIPQEEKKGSFIGNEYVITEMDQMLPLYGLTLQRNEFFVVWRDNHFGNNNYYNQYLAERIFFLNRIAKMNVYFESNTEEALRIISRKKYNKIILISNIGLDLAGKKFVEIARKILGFDVVVLFFSANSNHFKWLKNFKNALYTDNSNFYENYILNYNETGLKELKKEVENKYQFKFPEFTKDFLSFPKFIQEGKTYKETNFSEYCENFRRVYIYNDYTKYYIKMNNNGSVSLTKSKNNASIWDITLDNGEITLFSNNYYLYIMKDNENVGGKEYLEIGRYKKLKEDYYSISFKNKNLSIETMFFLFDSIKFKKCDIGQYEKFKFIDII